MKNLSFEIITNNNLDVVERILNSVSLKDGSIKGMISGKYLVGSTDNSKFKYITYDSPPMEINGTLTTLDNGTRIKISIKSDSMKGQLKAVTYALAYPLIVGILLFAIIKNPTSIATYIIGLFSLTIPLIIHYFYDLLWYHEPNPEYLIAKLTKDLNGRIENKNIG